MEKRISILSLVTFIFLLSIILTATAGAANKIMPLGDSITLGISSGVAQEEFYVSYRKELYDQLKAAGYVIDDELFVGTLTSGSSVPDFDPDHEGHDGWRTDQIVDGRGDQPARGKLDECKKYDNNFSFNDNYSYHARVLSTAA